MLHHRITLALLLTASSLLSMSTAAQEGHENDGWLTNYEEALETSKETGNLIMIEFAGSDWCSNCLRLKKMLFDKEEFQTFADKNLVLLLVDMPRKRKNQLSEEQEAHNKRLFEKYNKKGAFPTVLFLDQEGNIVERLTYPQQSTEEYMTVIKSVVEANK